jgi:CTP:molybdopterin cytidylyltransferase MocA
MPRAVSFAGVILAAGGSSPASRERALLPWHGSSLLQAHIHALYPYTDFVLVVGCRNAVALEPVVDANAAFLTVDPGAEPTLFSSLRAGLREVLNRGRDAAIVTPVDRSPVRASTVLHLRQALELAPHEVWAVAPEHAGRHGYPLVVGREMITAFLMAAPEQDVQSVQCAHQTNILYEAVDDPATVTDLEPQENYSRTAP